MAVLADEDVEEDPDRWCSYTQCGQELWQIAWQWVWNLRLTLGKTMQEGQTREIEWAPAKPAPAFLVPEENASQEYGTWQPAVAFGWAAGRFGADAFVLQENGTLRCPAGANLWLSEVRQENAFTEAQPFTSPLKRIVRAVRFGINIWGEMPKAIVLVASAWSVVSSLPLPRWSATPSCSSQCAG